MQVSRREFIKYMTALGLSSVAAGTLFSLPGCESGPEITPADTIVPSIEPPEVPTGTYLSVVRGESPAELVNTAIKALGGIERFVKPGDNVIIKPNICVAYHSYEYAATTNPEVVAAVVSLCHQAGARQVRVMDSPFGGTAEQAYKRTGIGDAVEAAGGEMELMSPIKFRKTPIPYGQDIKDWSVYGDAIDADVLINIPIAKHHGMARLTLGMKNLMGLIQDRPKFHGNLGQRIADLNTLLRPDLTIIDGVRILMNHGPSGGSLDDVKLANTVIASHDIVAADTYAATLFDLTGADIPATRTGARMGLGITDLSTVKIEELSV